MIRIASLLNFSSKHTIMIEKSSEFEIESLIILHIVLKAG